MAHAGAHDEHDDHDDHDDGHHDEPPPDEPATPLWLTMLGAVLFVSAGLVFLLMTGSPTGAEGASGAASAKPAAQHPPAAQPQVAPQPAVRPLGNLPLMRGAGDHH